MDISLLKKIGTECGFTDVEPLDVHTVELRYDVRGMCADGKCAKYGHCWSCPPACGTIEECREKIAGYAHGILVQTVRSLEDEFDGEGMMQAEADHKRAFDAMHERLRSLYTDVKALGAGACTRCKVCTYPNAPCRFPESMVSSMEAYGILVQKICADNGVKYYYGRNTITYTGCFLFGSNR